MAASRAPSGSSDPDALPNAGTWQTRTATKLVERGDAERDPRAHAVTPQCDRKLIEFGHRPGGVDASRYPCACTQGLISPRGSPSLEP